MPFIEVNEKESVRKRCCEDEKFHQEWNDAEMDYRIIGELIKERKRQGLTQKQLADMAGCKQQVISRYETKKVIPKLTTLKKVLHALDCNIQVVRNSIYL